MLCSSRILRNVCGTRLSETAKNGLSTTSVLGFDRRWRNERRLEKQPNRFGPLTNKPDYSFVDGRPAPISSNLYKRLLLQRQYAKTIVQLCKEVDSGKEMYQKKLAEEAEEKKRIIDRKLKPKGTKLLL